jgi:hypothetical protein
MGLASTLGRLVFGAISDVPGRDPVAPVALVIMLTGLLLGNAAGPLLIGVLPHPHGIAG